MQDNMEAIAFLMCAPSVGFVGSFLAKARFEGFDRSTDVSSPFMVSYACACICIGFGVAMLFFCA